ncbi:3-phosphoshikimate 1-carboxyvinyltransferase [Aliidiomarina quisquiliarum]|uniref:3-phosphoshikimate 1-carboxyvinyltransferase n=1 Tax=Aliidiomarina quisquiliarum TaxID=2938947 RepID=UPI00208E1AD7|nr:3-phosphoshikimate 1-carboxyvinyltransferase [Aliidiomarina quisquiliarum]MCO4320858.1 3-phosphoshikimate 1-carboxyvinyltransferase [Aliidiomarina quisquiliarum]
MTTHIQLQGPRQAQGTILLPGSKSISNRVLLLAALAQGTTRIENLLFSDDTHWMLQALSQLGVNIEQHKGYVAVQGAGGLLQAPTAERISLFLGNAGTAMRPLCAALAAATGQFELTGEPRMKERPIGPLVDALVQLGANIQYGEQAGFPPLLINGGGLRCGKVSIDGSLSSQYISAVLMVLPLLASTDTAQATELTLTGHVVSLPYIQLTVAMMRDFGVEITQLNERTFSIAGNQSYRSPGSYQVESDASSASYFLAAGAIAGAIRVEGVGSASRQGDKAFVDVLEQMGAVVSVEPHAMEVRAAKLVGGDFDLNAIPDAAMTIATLALFAQGPTRIRNIANWRIKETDRLHAMATELRKVGAQVEEGEDWIAITPPGFFNPPQKLKHATIATYNDHRMAMCFSLLAFDAAGVTILDPDCCHKTYPDYFTDFARLTLP